MLDVLIALGLVLGTLGLFLLGGLLLYWNDPNFDTPVLFTGTRSDET